MIFNYTYCTNVNLYGMLWASWVGDSPLYTSTPRLGQAQGTALTVGYPFPSGID